METTRDQERGLVVTTRLGLEDVLLLDAELGESIHRACGVNTHPQPPAPSPPHTHPRANVMIPS